MKTVLSPSILILFMMIASWSPCALAQPYIEFHVQGAVDDSSADRVLPVNFKLVFDTDAPPARMQGDVIFFDAIYIEAIDSAQSAQPTPVMLSTPIAAGELTDNLIYNSATGVLVLTSNTDLFGISHPMGDLSLSMTSLPDDPMDYALDTGVPIATLALTAANSSTVTWNQATGFTDSTGDRTGSFTISIGLVDDPRAASCIADLNTDGSLNFLDISKYLELYAEGCD